MNARRWLKEWAGRILGLGCYAAVLGLVALLMASECPSDPFGQSILGGDLPAGSNGEAPAGSPAPGAQGLGPAPALSGDRAPRAAWVSLFVENPTDRLARVSIVFRIAGVQVRQRLLTLNPRLTGGDSVLVGPDEADRIEVTGTLLGGTGRTQRSYNTPIEPQVYLLGRDFFIGGGLISHRLQPAGGEPSPQPDLDPDPDSDPDPDPDPTIDPNPDIDDPPVFTSLSARAQRVGGTDYAAAHRDPDNGDGVDSALNVYEGRAVVLSAAAVDPERADVSYAWTQIGGKSVGVLANGATVGFVAPALNGTPPSFDSAADATVVLRVTASDPAGNAATAAVTVFVRLLGDVDRDDYVEGVPPPTGRDADDYRDTADAAASASPDHANHERYDLDNNGDVDADDAEVVDANKNRRLGAP